MGAFDQTDPGMKRFRSPPYPAIDLAKAIERARTLYGKAHHYPVQSNVLADAWKYGVKSSGLWATAAALIQYGLLTDQGSGPSRRFQLTDAAVRIIKDHDPTSEKRTDAIKRAALSPAIFRELWDQFGAAEISDVVVRNLLTLDRREAGKAPFSDSAANDIIQAFKATITFAGVAPSDSVSGDGEDKGVDPAADAISESDTTTASEKVVLPPPPPPPPPPPSNNREVRIMAGERELTAGLLSKDASFRLIVTGQIGVKEIERLISKLEFDKAILLDGNEASADPKTN